jgi:hypothetical protein
VNFIDIIKNFVIDISHKMPIEEIIMSLIVDFGFLSPELREQRTACVRAVFTALHETPDQDTTPETAENETLVYARVYTSEHFGGVKQAVQSFFSATHNITAEIDPQGNDVIKLETLSAPAAVS